MELGMDSLMAVQLRNALDRALGLDRGLPATLMFDYPTIDALAARLLERLQVSDAAPDHAADAAVPAEAPIVLGANAVAAMSEEEVEALLMQRLGKP